MRSLIVIAMFLVSLAQAGWSDYEETRDLKLDAKGLELLSIKAGAGSMDVTGVSGLHQIVVKATVVVAESDKEDALRVIDKKMTLSLVRKGDTAQLDAWFESSFMGFGSDSHIALEISVPRGLNVNIDDGSGSINVVDLEADITIDDGSGSIDVENVAHVKIDDGSGSIDVSRASGDVSIVDGSGSINIRAVHGSVTIDDGSGSINVSDVEKNLIIIDDGSGSFKYTDIRGSIEQET